ncbi:MAG: NTP transferase domain-containing protein [Acidobacteria bacterium]|nr:NTP transferase domain-containing protein [Acidobacteriota bacterium]
MAAGRGNRMRPLTDRLPKALLPFRGETLISNSLALLRDRVPRIHVTVGYKSAMLAHYLMTAGVDSVLNTAGHSNSWWIHHTLLRHLDEPVLVLTADNITDIDIDLLALEYGRLGAPACMLVPVKPIPAIDGDYIEHDHGLVTSVQRQTPTGIYCSGIQVLNPAQVVSLTTDDGSFYSIWNQLIARRELRVSSVYPKQWFSVDTLEQLAAATQAFGPGAGG